MKPRVKPAIKKATRVDRCGVSKKRRYRTAAAARTALERLLELRAQQPDRPRRNERRIHSCVFCGGWHLTSQQ